MRSNRVIRWSLVIIVHYQGAIRSIRCRQDLWLCSICLSNKDIWTSILHLVMMARYDNMQISILVHLHRTIVVCIITPADTGQVGFITLCMEVIFVDRHGINRRTGVITHLFGVNDKTFISSGNDLTSATAVMCTVVLPLTPSCTFWSS